MTNGTAGPAAAPAVVMLLLVRWKPRALAWGLSRLVLGPRAIPRTPGLRFVKVLGSGRDGGFGLVPSLHHQGLIAFFDHEDQAREFVERSPVMAAYAARAAEHLVTLLRTSSSRGSWNGTSLSATVPADAEAPCAVLTRAAIRPWKALRFWRHSPSTEASIVAAPGCRLAVGLGEAPLLRQCTFSLWDSRASMDAYARHGAHGGAAAAAWREGWFSEWMFARLVPLSFAGTWNGRAHEPARPIAAAIPD